METGQCDICGKIKEIGVHGNALICRDCYDKMEDEG